MILFPNETVARPVDVRDDIRDEIREHGAVPVPLDVVELASLDSFPASDPPPWTLGSIDPPGRSRRSDTGVAGLSPREPPEQSGAESPGPGGALPGRGPGQTPGSGIHAGGGGRRLCHGLWQIHDETRPALWLRPNGRTSVPGGSRGFRYEEASP
jgi:hypothetical protein